MIRKISNKMKMLTAAAAIAAVLLPAGVAAASPSQVAGNGVGNGVGHARFDRRADDRIGHVRLDRRDPFRNDRFAVRDPFRHERLGLRDDFRHVHLDRRAHDIRHR